MFPAQRRTSREFPRLRAWHDGLHVWFGGHFPHDLGLPKERAGCGWQPMATTYLGPWHGGLKNIRGLDEFLYLMIIPKNKCVTEKRINTTPKASK